MALETINTPVVREMQGFCFLMRVAGSQQTVRIFVADDALDGLDLAAFEEDELRAQFDKFRREFEAVAREKYAHGRVAADGVVAITLADVTGFFE